MCSIALHPTAACHTTFKGLRPHDRRATRQGCCSRDRHMASFTKSLWSHSDSGWCTGTFMMPCTPHLLLTLCISPYDPAPELPLAGTKSCERRSARSSSAQKPSNDNGQNSATYRLGCTGTRALRGGGAAMDEGTSGWCSCVCGELAAGGAAGAGRPCGVDGAGNAAAAASLVDLLFFPFAMSL
jgi:hypothetical protein